MTKQSKVHKCNCKHESQDSIHGKQMRVMNPTTKANGNKQVFRCTVCGKSHDI